MSDQELSTKDSTPLVPIVENPYSAQDFLEVSGTQFLPRLQLFTSKSGPTSEGKIAMNHFGLVSFKDNIIDLGLETNVLVINWRPRALDTSDRSNIRSSFDPKSELFQEIRAKSAVQNSECQFGPEYLLWAFQAEMFCTFFMGGATTRNEAKVFHVLLSRVATMKSRLIKTEKYTWQSPFGVPCTENGFNFPPPEKLIEVQTQFLNASEQPGLEKASSQVVDR